MDILSIISITASIISIILAIVSIVYTCKTNKNTEKLLDDIRRQNNKLVDKINYELSKDNYDEVNIAHLRKRNVTALHK